MYTFNFLVSSPQGTGVIDLSVDGEDVAEGIQTPQTGSWDTFASFSETISLSSGEHVLRLKVENAGFNLDKIEISNDVLSIRDFNKKIIQIFPNPSETGIFNLPEPMVFKVYSINGKLLLNEHSDKVNLSQFSKGIYFFRSNNGMAKLIK